MVFVGGSLEFSPSLVCDIPGTGLKYHNMHIPRGVSLFPVTDQGCAPRHPISKVVIAIAFTDVGLLQPIFRLNLSLPAAVNSYNVLFTKRTFTLKPY